ncbi:MAG: DUF86 domain-containing protein [Gammaproteobacteria bacterium]|nr:DUF86 domain-containing protein [Gammaproteobacteria bacterium]
MNEYTESSKEIFFGSNLIQDAVIRNLQVLSESTMRLTTEIKATEPTIDWRRLRDFRNVLTHGYLLLDKELIWIALELLPPLRDAVERMRILAQRSTTATPPNDDSD